MKQAEYLKLVVSATTIVTKAKLLQEQLDVIAHDCAEHLANANEKLKGIETSLNKIHSNDAKQDTNELVIAGTSIKQMLHTVEKDLKHNVEHPAIQLNKQIGTIQEALQKLITQKESFGVEPEFDLTSVQDQIDTALTSLTASDQKLQAIMQDFNATQSACNRFEEANSFLMLEQELKEAAQKTSLLAHKISNIEHCIETDPALKAKHAEQFGPLIKAFAALTTKNKLLDLTKDIPVADEAPAVSPIKVKASPKAIK